MGACLELRAADRHERRRKVEGEDARMLFILSDSDRDRLATLATDAGWKAASSRRSEGAERRYLASDAAIALVDVRGGNSGLIELLAGPVEASGGALIALVDVAEIDSVASLIGLGATHYLCAPFDLAAVSATLEAAHALTMRLNGSGPPSPSTTAAGSPVQRRTRDERDYLTGLANRQAAVTWIEGQLSGANGAPYVLLLSIGPFDRVNAAYGQTAGDALLGRIARRIERAVEGYGAADTLIARIAGTEYMVGFVADKSGADVPLSLARSLIAAIGQPFSSGDHLIRLTGRCGIAEGLVGDDATRLLRRAGTALAAAKQSDGEGIHILTAQERVAEADPDRLESDLRLALDRGEIEIVFQPQYSCRTNALTGVEALARWNHPHYGALGAAALFAAAERSDFLLPLSAHIQAEALKQAAAWSNDLGHLRLSINVTASDISQPDFLAQFSSIVDSSAFPRERLTVEITESGLIEDVMKAAALLDRLRAMGFAVAIDDFGTGYSSLAYLKALTLDYLKIDSGLAQDIAGSEKDRIIVRGVIHMAKSLGMKVIAEGVETDEQRSLLTAEGCDYYQGFLRSRAVSSEDLLALVTG